MNSSLQSIQRVRFCPKQAYPVANCWKIKWHCLQIRINHSNHSLGHFRSINWVINVFFFWILFLRIRVSIQLNSKFYCIVWIVWDEPYAIGLLSTGIEVRVLDASGSMKHTFIQTLSDIQKARHLVRSKKGLLFAASVTQLYCIRGVDIQKQCQSLLQQKKFQLALQLTVSCV